MEQHSGVFSRNRPLKCVTYALIGTHFLSPPGSLFAGNITGLKTGYAQADLQNNTDSRVRNFMATLKSVARAFLHVPRNNMAPIAGRRLYARLFLKD